MKKQTGFIFVLMIFIGIPMLAKAAGSKDAEIKSCGNIFYESSAGSIKLFTADIELLREKLASVLGDIFDPGAYSRAREREYIEPTPTEHVHRAASISSCMIVFDGEEYPGYEKRCRCGYGWKEEMYHHLLYQPVDDNYHRISCALSDTAYCGGLASREEEHYTILCAIDESHHQSFCADCGFTGQIQECVFEDEKIKDNEKQPGEMKKYCQCGNVIMAPEAMDQEEEETGITEDTEPQPDLEETEDDIPQPDQERSGEEVLPEASEEPDDGGQKTEPEKPEEGETELPVEKTDRGENPDKQTETNSEGGSL